MPEPIDLTDDECRELLRSGVVGRVALCTADGPHVVPVNYSVVDDFVVLRTSPYSILGISARNAVLAFEVDHMDHERRHSWSVVVRGRCEWLDDTDTIDQVDAVWLPRPWASGSRPLVLRIPLTEVSGRKLGLHWRPLDELTVHRVQQPTDESSE